MTPVAVAPRRTAAPARTIRLHVVNDPDVAPLFHVSRQQIDAALRRRPRLSRRLRITVGMGADGFHEALPTVDVLVAYRFPHREVPGRAPRLRWIHEIGAGIDHLLPLDWLPPGVVLTNSRGVHAPKAGEWAAGALLMLNNLIPKFATDQRRHRWAQTFTDPIRGKTVAIVGVGMMGREVARWAKRLGLRVLGVRRGARRPRFVDRVYRREDMAAAIEQADFLVVTAPLTAETRGLIGRKELDLLRPTAGVVNMARGPVVDHEALADKLRSGELSGAVLDVFDPEPLPADSSLWDTPNLLVTPHVSSDPLDYTERMLGIFVDNLQRYAAGRTLRNRVRAGTQY